jgi:hypothetical protein
VGEMVFRGVLSSNKKLALKIHAKHKMVFGLNSFLVCIAQLTSFY